MIVDPHTAKSRRHVTFEKGTKTHDGNPKHFHTPYHKTAGDDGIVVCPAAKSAHNEVDRSTGSTAPGCAGPRSSLGAKKTTQETDLVAPTATQGAEDV